MEIAGAWISAFLTLAIFSFLYKDNPIYKFAEHLFIGASTGYVLILEFSNTLLPNLFIPLEKAMSGESPKGFWRLGALILGIMVLTRLVQKTSWVSRMPLALMIGIFATLRMTGLAQSDLVEQVNGTMVPLYGENLPWFSWTSPSIFNHFILVTGVICVLIYFFFSIEQKKPIKHFATVGTVFLMVTFGSSFGFTVLGRISLLIGRAHDLYQFSEPRYLFAAPICFLGIILCLIFWEFSQKKQI